MVWGCSPPAGSHPPKLPDVSDSSSALVTDHGEGEDGEFPYPVGNFPPAIPLDWASLCVKDLCPVVGIREGQEDPIVALLTAIGEDH